MRYIDPRLSKILADRMVAEAQSRPRGREQRLPQWVRRLEARLGGWLIAAGEKLTRPETDPA